MNVDGVRTTLKKVIPRFRKLLLAILFLVSFLTFVLYLTSDGLVERRPTPIDTYSNERDNYYERVSFVSVWGTWKRWFKSVDNDGRLYKVSEKVYLTSPFAPSLHQYGHLNTSERRLATVNDVCRYYHLDQEESFFQNSSNKVKSQRERVRCSVIMDDILKVNFCFIPKVGTTNLKRYMLNKSGINNYRTNPHEVAFQRLKIVTPAFFGPNQTSSYKKIMFTRHPFRRLVSAYLDKLNDPIKQSMHYKLYAVPIMKKYRGRNLDLKTHPLLTFEEFVDYLIDTPPSHYNRHWIPFWIRCEPCRVKYDYLGRMETMNQDTEFLFNTSLSTYDKPTNDSTALSLFAQVPLEKRMKLFEIYRLDFELFGYSAKGYL